MTRPSPPTRLPPLLLIVVAVFAEFFTPKYSSIDGRCRGFASAFLPRPIATTTSTGSAARRAVPKPPTLPSGPHPSTSHLPDVFRAPAAPASATRLHSLFGLGPAEVAIVLVAGLVVMGPSKLLEFSRGAGEAAAKTVAGAGDEWGAGLSSIPEEFKKGLEEGEIDARGRKARRMDDVDDGDDGGQ
jgi:Sec-independent protein translocase protein TatA